MEKEQHWSVGCYKFTAQVNTVGKNQKIVWAAPIFKKFLGQTLDELIAWVNTIGKCSYYEITPPEGS